MRFGLVKNFGKKFFTLESNKHFAIPPNATHVRVYAGKLCFGNSDLDNLPTDPVKTGKGKFFRIPKQATGVRFLEYNWKFGLGHFYGSPEWLN